MKWPALDFRVQLLIGAILPALLTIGLLGVTFHDRYLTDIEQAFAERGKTIVNQFGVTAEYAFFSGSFEMLDQLAAGVRQSDDEVTALQVFNLQGHRVAGGGREIAPLPMEERVQVLTDDRRLLVQGPIHRMPASFQDDPWASNANGGDLLGYVLVEISRESIEQRHREVLGIALVLAFCGLAISGWLSAHIAHEVLDRLEAARREVERQRSHALTLARTDALTGLANRRAFDETAEHEIRRTQRYEESIALIITDIDHFKSINDTHGHHVGDEVLKHFARTLEKAVREIDLVGRWGGEEFVVLMPGTQLEAAVRAAERMRLAVAGAPSRHAGITFGYTASFGVTAYSAHRNSVDALLCAADQALYRAKRNGRNRVEITA